LLFDHDSCDSPTLSVAVVETEMFALEVAYVAPEVGAVMLIAGGVVSAVEVLLEPLPGLVLGLVLGSDEEA